MGNNSARDKFSEHEIATARQWWDRRGRYLISREFNVDEYRPKVATGSKGAPGFKVDKLESPRLPSGILEGMPFQELTPHEQHRVIYVWRYMQDREHGHVNETDEQHMERLKLQ